jgi:hypothetical protein
MLLALAAIAALPDLVPARWPSSDPASLETVRMTPVNCLLIEQSHWSAAFNREALNRGIATFAVIRPDSGAGAVERAVDLRFSGGVLEGRFPQPQREAIRKVFADAKLPAIELTLRADMVMDGDVPVVGTFQGLWPGIHIDQDGAAKAAPSGAPWINTNTGFLRFARASTESVIWIANLPPPGSSYPIGRYLQVIGDAAITGARWVIALDDVFARKLLSGEQKAIDDWRRLGRVLAFYEAHSEWRTAEPFAQLAVIEDRESGALLSGGILDMIAVKHTPVRPVPRGRLQGEILAPSMMAVNVDPEALSDGQREALKVFTRAGGTLLTGPPGWKFPLPRADQITLEEDDLKKLEDIWRELNSMTGRKNLGARLFNVSSMLSNVVEIPASNRVVISLVNYSDFPVENVTAHVLGKYGSGILLQPDGPPIPLTGYEVEGGTGFDIDRVVEVAAIVLTR